MKPLTRPQQEALNWIQQHQGVAIRRSDALWQPGANPNQDRFMNQRTMESLHQRGLIRWSLTRMSRGREQPVRAEVV